jgi:RNA polymerase sigma factor (TIGR02999 family)
VYDELRRIAHRELKRERAGHTLSTTALVSECYLRLLGDTHIEWADRVSFLSAAAIAMRRILVDYARTRSRAKRGGGKLQMALDEADLAVENRAELLVALDEALGRLTALDERLGRVVEFRFFGGMTEEEIASALGVTPRTVRRDWLKARAWLYTELGAD